MASFERQSSPIRAGYHDLSSPDPLGDPSDEDIASALPSRRTSAAVMRKRRSDAGQRRMSNDIGSAVSPSKMITEQSLSPWRIKVTVEAEPEEGGAEEASNGRTQTITRTMKVPLRDDSSPTKASRPRSNLKRNGPRHGPSPVRATRSRRQSVTDLEIVVLGDDAEEDEWNTKPRSARKRRDSKSQVLKRAIPASRISGSGVFEIREDEGSVNAAQDEARQSAEDGSPELKDIDLNQVVMGARLNSSMQKDANVALKGRPSNVRTVSLNSAMSYPTPSPTASEHGNSDDHDPQQEDHSEQHEIGLDTVMESEGFTMIDLDSLHSVKQMRTTPDHPIIQEEEEESEHTVSGETSHEISQVNADEPSIAVTNDGTADSSALPSSPPDSPSGGEKKAYSIAHLQLPSSTNVQRHRLVTPMPVDHNPFSSPKLPSPPKPPAPNTQERFPIHSDQAVQAGSALQDAVTPEQSMLDEQIGPASETSKEEEILFGGFSSSTRRELRAELRFGEELGKKQSQKQQHPLQPVPSKRPQLWRSETTEQRTPQIDGQQATLSEQRENMTVSNKHDFAVGEARLQRKMQDERQQVVEQAKYNDTVSIESDDEEQEEDGDVDETIGDIWLAEAKQKISSPREAEGQPRALKDVSSDRARRKLIPSPWKRGQQVDTSALTTDESFSGLFWKQTSSDASGVRFGDAIVAHPERVNRGVQHFDRRRSGEFDAETMTPKPTRRLSPRREVDDDDQDIEDENFDAARAGLQWRSAEAVIEEETSALEAGHDHDDDALAEEPDEHDAGATRLYETNLENVPEQDLSSSPHIQRKHKEQAHDIEHDSTYSSITDSSSIEIYRQRTSLSPSKERPNTPKSALKGARVSLGTALNYGDSDEANARRVMWAKRSSCVNELWEESTRSVRSTHESSLEETPTPAKQASQGIEASFEVQPQPPVQDEPKGWFGWFNKDTTIAESKMNEQARQQARPASGLDGSLDSFIKADDYENSDSSYAPTSRHESVDVQPVETRHRSQPRIPSMQRMPINNHDGNLSRTSSSPQQQPSTNTKMTSKTPSYLQPPSYPSDPARDPSVPLSTSGPFTNTHFRTLNIIHRKSQKARFRGPAYPDEIRPTILDLVEAKWKLEVDESASMDEDGLFCFTIGGTEARVLERFMREVELGYREHGVDEDIRWGWSAEDLAEKLGRIAIGERVREEEKAVEGILRSARKLR